MREPANEVSISFRLYAEGMNDSIVVGADTSVGSFCEYTGTAKLTQICNNAPAPLDVEIRADPGNPGTRPFKVRYGRTFATEIQLAPGETGRVRVDLDGPVEVLAAGRVIATGAKGTCLIVSTPTPYWPPLPVDNDNGSGGSVPGTGSGPGSRPVPQRGPAET